MIQILLFSLIKFKFCMKKKFYFSTLLAIGIFCYQQGVFAKPFLPLNTKTNLFNKTKDASLSRKVAPIVIKGIVIGDDGLPMLGVTVTLKGTKVRAITDRNGSYTIRVPDNTAILVFTSTGYKAQEITVASQNTIDVKMTSSASALDEVVVIGYGTQRARNLTSSISTEKGIDIEKYHSATFQTSLEGRMAGVEMNESSGVPGAAVNIRIRGLNTINGSAGPLYIVDGIPIISGAGGDGDQPMTNNDVAGVESNPLTDINPNDIATVEVLKDAAATAIYGARGGGGVILITTKRAQKGKSLFSLRSTIGFSQISHVHPLLNGPQLLSVLDEAYANSFHSVVANAGLPVPATPLSTGLIGFDRGMADTTNINHLNDILRNGIYHDVNLTASNGVGNTRFFLSGLYRTTAATFKGNDLNQVSARLNVDHDFNSNVRFGGSFAPSFSNNWALGSGAAFNVGGYGAAVTANLPIYPNYNADGSYFNPWNNDLAFLNRNLYYNNQKRLNVIGSAYLDVTLLTGLNFRTTLQRQDFNQVANGYTDGSLRLNNLGASASPFANDPITRITQQNSFGYTNSMDSYFSYNKVFNSVHQVSATLGMRYSKADFAYEAIYGDNFANNNQQYPSQAAYTENGFQTGAQGDPSANLGYFFRTNYSYKQRYLLGVVINRDGSSRFGTAQRYGTFPAVSGGWIASDESFLKNNKVLSFLKFRVSAGLTGSAQGISNTAAKSTWGNTASAYKNDPGNTPNQPADANLRWEKEVKYDAGVDMGFFNDRVNLTLDWYHYTTTGLLLSIPAPVTFGYGAPSSSLTYLENRGALLNRGLDLTISSVNITGKFQWLTTFNISHNTTYIISLDGLTPDQVSAASPNAQVFAGHNGPVYNVIQWAGVDPATGGELIIDKNGNKVLASTQTTQQLSDDRKPQYDKSPAPKYYGGFGNTFSYLGFSLNVFFAYRYGNYLLDAGERQKEYVGDYSFANSGNTIVIGNLSPVILNRWTTPGQITNIPKLYYNDPKNDVLRQLNTSRFLSDASFIRLKMLDLSYTIPQRFIRHFGLRSAVINVTGQNLLLFTKFKGDDPEAQTIVTNYTNRNIGYGIVSNALPLPITLTAGVNVGF